MKLELIHVGSRQKVVLNRRSAIIGRASDADLPLDDPELGDYECLISDTDQAALEIWSLRPEDVHTLVNGQPITKAKLKPGDTLTVGRTEFEVRYALDAQSALTPPHWLSAVPGATATFNASAGEIS
jgi:pSer/pThr/pTyr-binding forkhead associated (FHA) protein